METPTHTATPIALDRLFRRCSIQKRSGHFMDDDYKSWMEPSIFHGWTKINRCAIGDGSMIDWMTLAIIEMPDGSVTYCEPHELVFETNS